MSRLVGIVVVVIVLAAAGWVYQTVVNPDHRGQVIFTTTSQSANDNCKITNRVDTIKAGSDVYLTVMWSRTMSSSDVVVEEDFKDGTSMGTETWSPSHYAGYDCFTATDNLGDSFTEPGKYEIKLTAGSDVVADGTLTVTP